MATFEFTTIFFLLLEIPQKHPVKSFRKSLFEETFTLAVFNFLKTTQIETAWEPKMGP